MLTVPPTVDVVDLTQTRPSLLVDPFRIRRVFLNILKNALDVMPDGGKLTLTSQQNGGMVRISFSDTGPGIPLEMQEKLFQPLFTTKAKGMGFGLAICQRIVEAHSGAISFQTALGQGTTFFIDLPHAERS
jgi:signal transduction histidine kinase